MKYLIQAPGVPSFEGEYIDEIEARSTFRTRHPGFNMSSVKVTPIWYWLRPTPDSPVSGPYTETGARERFSDGQVAWPHQELLKGPRKGRLAHIAGFDPNQRVTRPRKQRSSVPQATTSTITVTIKYDFSDATDEWLQDRAGWRSYIAGQLEYLSETAASHGIRVETSPIHPG